MRANFAAAYGQRADDEKSVNRNESLSAAFNSPFWPFVLVSTSIGQEGLDFHLWSHAVVHWNLPSNPVDLEQREGRVHRYKGHVVRKNIAETLASSPETTFVGDIWDALFKLAAEQRKSGESELVPYWIYPQGSAKIERHIPLLPFSREASELPRLKNSLAAYRLAFGQPRQEDLVEFLRRNYSESDTESLIQKFQINLTPPAREVSSSKPD
jgi:superfamily II DNA/RNA helicase